MNMNAQNYLQNDVQNDVQFNVQRFNNYVDDLLNISAVNYGCTSNKVKRHVEYVNRLLRYHANNYKVLAIIDTLFQRVDEKYEYLKNKRIQIRDRLLIVFREGFNNTFDMYNEYDDNEQEPCGRFKLDIHVHYPLERQKMNSLKNLMIRLYFLFNLNCFVLLIFHVLYIHIVCVI